MSPRGRRQSRVYDVAPDDERFLMLRLEAKEIRELILVLNWFEELEARVPG